MAGNGDAVLRNQLKDLLEEGNAHVNFDKATRGLSPQLRGQRPPGMEHSAWELVEHMRIAQWDILEFVRNPKHASPDFPTGYWPRDPAPPGPEDWEKSLQKFRADRAAFLKMIEDPSINLLAPMPHANGQPILQKVLLTADHNAYHLGQLVLLRKLLGAWK